MTAIDDPKTTTIHYFGAYPDVIGYDSFKQDLQVTVMPPLGDYRIYFRAINDYIHYNGGTSTSEFLYGDYSKYPTEDYNSYSSNATLSNNWNDWWHDDTYRGIYNADHRIYIYTQMGETLGTSTPNVWKFTGDYGSATYMTGDNTNPGWYYYDLDQNKTATLNGETKKPEPGKTLMIFYALKNGDYGYEPHRASHHLDPGISLFDYEDREGWVIYDPTSEPYYRIYDEKPYMEDVTFTVYSTQKVTGWWHTYGVAENNVSFNNPQQWTIKYDLRSSDYGPSVTANGKTYYAAKIKLKCPHGDYEKAIKLTGLTPGSSTPTTQQRAYYARVIGKAGYDNPRIYVYNSDQDKMTDWSATPLMTKEKTENGIDYYYYDIPARYANGYVIFQNNNRSQQHTKDGQALEGKTKLTYSDNAGYWQPYGTQPSGGGNGVMLFGGRSFASAGHVGTYENGVWKAGRP